jgi:MFS family permease
MRSQATESTGDSPPSAVRHLVLAGMTASVLVAYLPRTGLAPAVSSIKRELGLSETAMGEVLGIWAIGYVCLQLPGGWLGDRLGRRRILPLLGVSWSLCTIATAAAASFAGLWWSRLIFGMAQGGLIPCLTRACIDWFPQDRRGTASAAITAGMSAGAVAASGLCAILLPPLGWRLTLQLLALTGVAWAVGFWIIFRDRPEQHPWVNQAEIALIRRGNPAADQPAHEGPRDPIELAPPTLRRSTMRARWAAHLGVYGSLAFLMINAQGFCRSFWYEFIKTWFPYYLERAHGMPVARASAMTMFPLAAYALGAILGGPMIDEVLRRTGSKRRSRSAVGAAALLLAGAGSLAAIGAVNPAAALVALTLGSAASGFSAPATWAATMDVGGKSSGSVMAVGNMTGNLGAFLCPVAVGAILDTFPGKWGTALLMLAIVSITGGLCWLLVNSDVREWSDRAPSPH